MGPGVLIADVVTDGPASKGGIKPWDVITKIQGAAVTDPKEVVDAVAAHKPGDTLSVTVRHAVEGKDVDVTITLGANPNDATKAYMGVTTRSIMEMPVPGPQGPGGMPGQRMTPPDHAPPGI